MIKLIGFSLLLGCASFSHAINGASPDFSCYSYPIAKEFLLNPQSIQADHNLTEENLWLGKISGYAIRQRRHLTFDIMIIAEQLAFTEDIRAYDLEKVKSGQSIRVTGDDLGSFALYMQINPRNLAQRDNLKAFIEDELKSENAHVFASGRVDRLIDLEGKRYPLLSYTQISLGSDYKIEHDRKPRLFRTDIAFGQNVQDSGRQNSAFCDQLKSCANRWDRYAAIGCQANGQQPASGDSMQDRD